MGLPGAAPPWPRRRVPRRPVGPGLWPALGLAAVLATTSPPAAQSGGGDWQLMRLAQGCAAVQTVLGRRTGAELARLVLSPAAQGGALVLLQVPNGADLAEGPAYRHPGGPAVVLEWQHCDAERCTASGPVTAAELDRLRRGREMQLGYRPLPESRPLNLTISLMGLTRSLAAAATCAG